MTQFAANAIGFFLDIDASKFKAGFKDATKSYADFTKVLTKANDSLQDRAEKSLNTLAKVGTAFSDMNKKALRDYSATVLAIERQARARPIKQPIEFIFTNNSSRVISDALGSAIARALGKATISMHPDRAGAATAEVGKRGRRRGGSPPSAQGDSAYVGSINIPQPRQRFAGSTHDVRVIQGGAGIPAVGDRVTAAFNPGDIVTSRESERGFTSEVRRARQISEKSVSGMRDVRAIVAAIPQAVKEATAELQSRINVSRRYAGLARAGVDIDPDELAAIRAGVSGARAGLGRAIGGKTASMLDPAALSFINKTITASEKLDKSLGSIEKHGRAIFGGPEHESDANSATGGLMRRIFGRFGVKSQQYLALSQATRDFRGSIDRTFGGIAGGQMAAGRMTATQTGSYDQSVLAQLLRASGRGVNINEALGAAQALRSSGFGAGAQFGGLGTTVSQLSASRGVDAGTLASLAQTLRSAGGQGESQIRLGLAGMGARSMGLDAGQIFGATANVVRGASSLIRAHGKSAQSITEVVTAVTRAGGDVSVGETVAQIFSLAAEGDPSALKAASLLGATNVSLRAFAGGNPRPIVVGLQNASKRLARLDPIALNATAAAFGIDKYTLNVLASSKGMASGVSAQSGSEQSAALGKLGAQAAASKHISETASNLYNTAGASIDNLTGGALTGVTQFPTSQFLAPLGIAFAGNRLLQGTRSMLRGRGGAAGGIPSVTGGGSRISRAISGIVGDGVQPVYVTNWEGAMGGGPNAGGAGPGAAGTPARGGRRWGRAGIAGGIGAAGGAAYALSQGGGAADAVSGGLMAAGTGIAIGEVAALAVGGAIAWPVLLAGLAAMGVGYGVSKMFEAGTPDAVPAVESARGGDGDRHLAEIARNTRRGPGDDLWLASIAANGGLAQFRRPGGP